MSEVLVHVDSTHEYHRGMFKTLTLLALDLADGSALFFVVEGRAEFDSLDKIREYDRYFYEEHTCPTNFIRTEAIVTDGDFDAHGVFRYVDSAWLTEEYIAAKEAGTEQESLTRMFPLLLSHARRRAALIPNESSERNERD